MASITAGDLSQAMQRIAPLELAETWDNVGLLVGRADRALEGPVVLAIDLTEAVLGEAISARASALVAYHPPVWEPLKRVTDSTRKGRILLRAIEAGLAVYSPHTALDAVEGGVTDWLAEGLSGSTTAGKIAGDCRALCPHAHLDVHQQVKIVTFVPEAQVDSVRKALASAGAGIIGGYQVCSFATAGLGTFFGGEGTSPVTGQAGRLESVREVRLEMVCSKAALALAMETLERFHPYEEPAVDVYELVGRPRRHAGAGRRLALDQPATLAELGARLKRHVGGATVKVAMPGNADRAVSRVAICPGSGASLLPAVVNDECEAFVTGEMKHHEVLAAVDAGIAVILAGHTETERGYLPRLAERLERELPGVRAVVSKEDRSPLRVL